eukprot:7420623-Alexandrium_andersonii.AAC.1
MSASLVGSEMCIRDSFSSVRHRLREALVMLDRGKRSLQTGVPGSLACRTCLLYTSDAADDM